MIDKSWIDKPIKSNEFLDGVVQFLDFAFSNAAINGQILCPCNVCGFYHRSRVEVFSHLLEKGFPSKYTFWNMHGEKHDQPNAESVSKVNEASVRQYPMQDMLNDIFGVFGDQRNQDSCPSSLPNGDHPMGTNDVSNKELKTIKEVMEDGNQELYHGCTKYSKLSFIVRLYHIKVLCGATDKTFSMIIELLSDAFPHANLPSSFYQAKKMIKRLGLSYDKIHACPQHCMLYWGSPEDEKRDKCKICNTSRWKSNENDGATNNVMDDQKKKKRQPKKVLRYFPLIPRLQRLYTSSKTAELLKWHAMDENPDGLLRHPRDTKAWKNFDSLYPDFALDPRNVRLALATDGFNPFGTLSSSNSLWPVMLYLYNYPPWCCMKQTSLIMSMIIPGPKMPGNNIDVYLQPLVAELKSLWVGVDAYDSSTKETFQMRAALFCTISDFPGLDNLSGWNTHTLFSCPTCKFDTESKRLKFGRKNCFMGHRRYLPLDHRYRRNKQSFDGSVELRLPPIPMTGSDILRQIEDNRKRLDGEGTSQDGPQQWKKKSIFWDLPYWEHNLIRHCLDMMHIEKNVCDNILFTVLDDKKRTKDNLQARKDLQEMGIRERLHPYPNSSKFPQSCFKMKNMERDMFLKILKNVVFPDSYASNISRCVDTKKRKVFGLKSHDSHILMEHLLPIAFRKSLPKEVALVLIELCNYFREISCKVLDVKNIEKLQQRIALTLCHMEMIFPLKMVATQVWHLEKTKKVLVQINGNGQGNDSGSNLLVRFLGQLAQKSAFCPVSVERWDEMSNDSSIEQWKCIEDHFEFDYAAGIKWVRSTLGDRWKAYKYKLRCHYFLPNKSKDEILATLPPGVDHVEWAAFVHHYKKETMQKLSEQNSKNRKNLKVSHAGGSKSNARRAHQMEQKLGRPVCRSEVKLSTLLKKNGNYVNEEGKVMADKISENLSEDQERVATKGVPSKINAYPDDAIGKLCGPEHAGRVRVLGLGVSPTYVFTNHMHFTQFIQTGSSSQMNVENFQNKVVDLEEKLEGYEETKQQLTQTTEELTQTKEKLAQATTKLTKVERFLQHKYGDELSMFDL